MTPLPQSPPAPPEVETMAPALWCRRGDPPQMQSMHRHDDLEINAVLRGELRYVFAGRPFVVREGQIALFWAAQPHGLVDSRAGDVCWMHVPISTLLGWNLPEAEISALLRPQPLVTDSELVRARIESMMPSWLAEYQDDETSALVLLEIRATVRRALRAALADGPVRSPFAEVDEGTFRADGARRMPEDSIAHTMTMAQFVIERFREPLRIEDVSAAAHLTPSHAMTVFRRTVGATIGEYLTMCRVAEAQRLLMTTSAAMPEVAERSGFGSLSSFYAHVSAACGMAPRQYRQRMS
ncbi:AraC family transcriptional regulator [Brachybacterium sp. P6-10-X1]|uniref:helix-turn-helix domain-containing protein n=1 Tax=Brachybacterium sp. P6-10-X1 TaxID=1903186 RepID=UPI0009718264|nr:helix-turn-helix domain-containing protein [Brachybacterium sp. P6-10-X1]APX32138.1 AraC family transcriptional regulator [Brachybacterium sp. P6-10-X1]